MYDLGNGYSVDPDTGDVIPMGGTSPVVSDNPYDNFWKNMGPGLFNLGAGLYTSNLAQQDASKRLAAAQGPAYQAAISGATGMLNAGNKFNPQAYATDQFNKQQALLQPVYDKQLNDLMSTLRARGQLGIATYNPGVEGITPNGTAMNPQLAAFYAARNAQQAKDAYASMQEGQNYRTNLLKDAGMLSTQAGQLQNTGLAAQNVIPSRATAAQQILQGVGSVLKSNPKILPGMLSAAGGYLKSGLDWLGNAASGLFGDSDLAFDF